MGPLEPTKYGEQFHELYINCLDNRYVNGINSVQKMKIILILIEIITTMIYGNI